MPSMAPTASRMAALIVRLTRLTIEERRGRLPARLLSYCPEQCALQRRRRFECVHDFAFALTLRRRINSSEHRRIGRRSEPNDVMKEGS